MRMRGSSIPTALGGGRGSQFAEVFYYYYNISQPSERSAGGLARATRVAAGVARFRSTTNRWSPSSSKPVERSPARHRRVSSQRAAPASSSPSASAPSRPAACRRAEERQGVLGEDRQGGARAAVTRSYAPIHRMRPLPARSDVSSQRPRLKPRIASAFCHRSTSVHRHLRRAMASTGRDTAAGADVEALAPGRAVQHGLRARASLGDEAARPHRARRRA